MKIINTSQEILDESAHKPNKIQIGEGSKFYNRLIKQKQIYNGIEIVQHIIKKSVVAEKFIRELKCKVYKQMTSISKHVYIHKLADIVHKCNNIYHSTIKMKSVD